MAANLSAVMDDTDKVQIFYDDARENGLEILPPDVNASAIASCRSTRKRVRYGLGAVKGTGEQAIENIVAAREAGGPVPGPGRLLPPRRPPDREPARDGGAHPRGRLRLRSSPIARACSPRSATRSRAPTRRSSSRRRRASSAAREGRPRGLRAHARPDVERARAAAEREAEPRLLPFAATLQRVPRRAAPLRAHLARQRRAARSSR